MFNVKHGVTDTIREVLGIEPTTVEFGEIRFGNFFETENKNVFVKINDSMAIDMFGDPGTFDAHARVIPLAVTVEADYVLEKTVVGHSNANLNIGVIIDAKNVKKPISELIKRC